jgi:predicted Fe-Mo cluster-binding NifX family protein
MKAAFAIWDNRVAPVFDVAREIYVVYSDSGRITKQEVEHIRNDDPAQKALMLAELGVTTLVCGAISRELLAAISAYGICVIPFIAGDLREVVQAHLEGTVHRHEYAMPGYHRRRRPDHTGRRQPWSNPHAGKRKGR